MASRVVDGPSENWLSAAQVRKELGGISNGTLRKLIQSGEFPAPLEVVPGGMRMWTWDDVVYWRLRVDRRDRLKGEILEAGNVKPRHSTDKPRQSGN